jgi:hypothetical protein
LGIQISDLHLQQLVFSQLNRFIRYLEHISEIVYILSDKFRPTGRPTFQYRSGAEQVNVTKTSKAKQIVLVWAYQTGRRIPVRVAGVNAPVEARLVWAHTPGVQVSL